MQQAGAENQFLRTAGIPAMLQIAKHVCAGLRVPFTDLVREIATEAYLTLVDPEYAAMREREERADALVARLSADPELLRMVAAKAEQVLARREQAA